MTSADRCVVNPVQIDRGSAEEQNRRTPFRDSNRTQLPEILFALAIASLVSLTDNAPS
jgi:hypothetical protein